MILVAALLFIMTKGFAQVSVQCETSSEFSTAAGWTFASGISEGTYNNPLNNCVSDIGIITPGVGGNNPGSIITKAYTSQGLSTIGLTFDMFCLDANLKCNTWKDFNCTTSLDIYYWVGNVRYNGIIDFTMPSNGPTGSSRNYFSMNVGNTLPAGTQFKFELLFKPKSGVGNCIQGNTKYVLDNFTYCDTIYSIKAQNDNFCAVSNDPYTFIGNVMVNDTTYNGSNIAYSILSGPTAVGSTIPGGATVAIENNGTFVITRTDVTKSVFRFMYLMYDHVKQLSDSAMVQVCFPDAASLPVNLQYFLAARKNNQVDVSWKTLTETDIASFEIERKVGSNGAFVSIGNVQARKTATGQTYAYNDLNEFTTSSQYRLKIVYNNNQFEYSPIKNIAGINNPIDLSILPNPSYNGSVKVQLNNDASNNNYAICVLDNAGRLVRKIGQFAGDSFTITGLKQGFYVLRVMNAATGQTVTKKIIVAHE